MNMHKHIMIALIGIAASYSASSLAASGNVAGSGNIGSGAWGTDNFTMASNIGSNPNAAGRGPGSLSYSLHQVFFGDGVLTFNPDGILVDSNGKPFTGTTATGEVFSEGKKQ
jgi:hypothetical protein